MTQNKQKNRRETESAHKIDSEILSHLAAGLSLISKNNDIKKNNLAIKHIKKARKIAMRKTIRLPRAIRAQFCNNCKIPLIAGQNCFIRVKQKRAILHCKTCKHMQKFGNSEKN